MKPKNIVEMFAKKTGDFKGDIGDIIHEGKQIKVNIRNYSIHDERPTIEFILDKYDRVKIRY